MIDSGLAQKAAPERFLPDQLQGCAGVPPLLAQTLKGRAEQLGLHARQLANAHPHVAQPRLRMGLQGPVDLVKQRIYQRHLVHLDPPAPAPSADPRQRLGVLFKQPALAKAGVDQQRGPL